MPGGRATCSNCPAQTFARRAPCTSQFRFCWCCRYLRDAPPPLMWIGPKPVGTAHPTTRSWRRGANPRLIRPCRTGCQPTHGFRRALADMRTEVRSEFSEDQGEAASESACRSLAWAARPVENVSERSASRKAASSIRFGKGRPSTVVPSIGTDHSGVRNLSVRR